MKIADFSVDRPVAISMLIIAFVVLGLFALPRLAIDLFPEMDLPVAIVSTSYEGASPAEVEELVSKPLEAAMATIENISEIQSISQYGFSMVVVLFNWGTDMDNAAIDLREKIDFVGGMLPDDTSSPRVMKLNPNQAPIISYSLTGANEDLVKLKRIAEDDIQPRLERIEGVGSVYITGGKTREIKVVLDPAKMEAYGLSPGQVRQAIAADNISGTAGQVDKGSSQTTIRVVGEYKSLDELKEVRISLATGNSIALKDLAAIEDGFKEEDTLTYTDGKTSLSISVMKATGGNTVTVANEVMAEVEKLNNTLPDGVKLTTIMDTSKFIKDSINSLVEHGLLGGILAIIVLYLFLRSFRSTLVIALTIPISIIATFFMMYLGNQSINLLSLGGLVLGLGSLVDFSVVVLESIYRYRQNGFGIIEAAKKGTAEVSTAVTASALCQVTVFMPIAFVTGIAGILFRPMALTVSFSHIAALFAALTLVPMMSAKLLQNVAPADDTLPDGKTKNPVILFGKFFHSLTQRYGHILRWSLGNRIKVVVVTVVLLIASIAVTPLIGTEFIPSMDQGELTVNIEMPAGTKLEETSRVAADLEKLALNQIKEIDLVFTSVGGGQMSFLGGSNSDQASLYIKLVPLEERQITAEQAAEKLRQATQNIPGADITVAVADGAGAHTGSAVEIGIRGDDLDVLEQIGDLLVETVKDIEGTRNVTNSLTEATSELRINVDREQAARYGLSASQIISAVSTSFDGSLAGRMRTGADEVDIRMLTPEDAGKSTDTLANLTIVSPTGARVPVSAVASIESHQMPTAISRADQSRQVTVTADVTDRDIGSVNMDIQTTLDRFAIPDGYEISFGGQAEDMAESFVSLGMALLLSMLLVFMVMAALFESLFQPFIIMFALPPTYIGAIFGLGITGNSISVTAMIGAIMLVGVVLNNSIVLVNYINVLRQRGHERDEAVLMAGPIRLRPILMTALVTVLAILPMAFGGGEGSEAQAPMAIVIAFGLTFSTVITLVLVPVVYTLFDDLGKKLSGKFTKLTFHKSKTKSI